MPTQLLSAPPERWLDLAPGIGLALARAHEACGPARRTFALWLAGRTRGPVLWIAPAWGADQPNPDGMVALADPARFLFIRPARAPDLLWCAEEALRAGAAALVVADLPAPPGLTPVRRLHLAAEAGAGRGLVSLGLLLSAGDGGAQGVESRWHMAPAHTGPALRWRLERRRARTLPPAAWDLAPDRRGILAARPATES